MKKFVQFECHTDEYPFIHTAIIEESEATNYAKQMNESYPSVTSKFKKVLTKGEAAIYIIDCINSIIDSAPLREDYSIDCESAKDIYIALDEFDKCYK